MKFNSLKESLEAKYEKRSESECWLWKAAFGHGYGSFTFKQKRYIASRASYKVYIGEIPENFYVCHKCDNPACVNPGHLFLGTHTKNMQDMVKKGRSAKGSKHSQSKLIESDIIKIRQMLKTKMTQVEIASIFNVKREAISKIKLNKRWGYV